MLSAANIHLVNQIPSKLGWLIYLCCDVVLSCGRLSTTASCLEKRSSYGEDALTLTHSRVYVEVTCSNEPASRAAKRYTLMK